MCDIETIGCLCECNVTEGLAEVHFISCRSLIDMSSWMT
jgi:hypothetical protein